MLDTLESAFFGTRWARNQHRRALSRKPSVTAGIAELSARCPAPAEDDARPIFLLSAGWRSGSTLLQRLIMSDPRVLIWGEPYDECGLIQTLSESMKAFRADWPPRDYFYDGTPPSQLTGEWVANLFPSLEDLRRAQRALFDTMFAQPAYRVGVERWGIKEVRLTAEHCHYLRWLYPKARFVFLYRNPLEAYRSYCRYGRSWYDTFPDRPVFTPTQFGVHWRKLMEGFVREAPALDALLVKYEDVVGGRWPLDELDAYLGIQSDRGVLTKKVGSSERGGHKATVNWLERWLLKRAVGPMGAEMDYRW